MTTIQLVDFYLPFDAMSRFAMLNHQIDKKYDEAYLVTDMFSAGKPNSSILPMYAHAVNNSNMLGLFKRFIKMPNKLYYLNLYMENLKSYNPKIKDIIEKANLRIWQNPQHFNTWWKVHRNDVVFFHNFTYPYLINSGYSELMAKEVNRLKIYNDLHINWFTHTEFNIRSLRNYGIDVNEYTLLPHPHSYDLNYTKHPIDKPHLLAFSRYGNGKKHPQLAKMASENNLNLMIFGDAESTIEYKNNYLKAKEYESDAITIMGRQPREMFNSHFKNANIYISASEHEGWGQPLIESYAHSLPVLAKRGTGMDETVVDGKTGYLFDSLGEVPHLADEILKNYDTFSHNAWKESQKYTLKKYEKDYRKAIKNIRR